MPKSICSQLPAVGGVLTLAAGAEQPYDITAEFVRVVEADYGFMLKVESQAWCNVDIGWQYRSANRELFTGIILRNPNTFPVNLRLQHGVGEITDDRLNVVSTRPNQFVAFADAPSFTATTDARTAGSAAYSTSLSAAAGVFLSANRWRPGSTSIQCGRRKAAWITNNDPLSTLEVRRAAVSGGTWQTSVTFVAYDLIALVQPKTTLRLDVCDDLAIVNATGSAISLVIAETFYTY